MVYIQNDDSIELNNEDLKNKFKEFLDSLDYSKCIIEYTEPKLFIDDKMHQLFYNSLAQYMMRAKLVYLSDENIADFKEEAIKQLHINIDTHKTMRGITTILIDYMLNPSIFSDYEGCGMLKASVPMWIHRNTIRRSK